jgi:hypothetical protein
MELGEINRDMLLGAILVCTPRTAELAFEPSSSSIPQKSKKKPPDIIVNI